jgi:hypothetical protein
VASVWISFILKTGSWNIPNGGNIQKPSTV